MKKTSVIVFLLLSFRLLNAQNVDSIFIKSVFSNALTDNSSYENLRFLCKNFKGRIGGTEQSLKAITWLNKRLKETGADTVYLQECKVRHWVRGNQEICYAEKPSMGRQNYNVCALGGSVGTSIKGIKANIIEVESIPELKELGEAKIKGKIVFFNRPADPSLYNTYAAYGGSADQRVIGASIAASYGAVASINRSLTVYLNDFPHTGIMYYIDSLPKIPAFAISTADADILSKLIKKDPLTNVYLQSTCHELADTTSYNVIAEIKGTEFPNEVIAVSGHVDAWELGEGAHDDGAGVVQAMDVLRLIRALNYKPKHTIRIIEFIDEEMAQRGGRKYAETVKNKDEKHIAAIESDEGALLPEGFSFESGDNKIEKRFEEWKSLLLPYGLWNFHRGYSGVDISFLEDQKFPLFGLSNDSQHYFLYHHSAGDVFENVNIRELQLGTASMASLVYLIDKYGF
jgi:carboxypeptidase Q